MEDILLTRAREDFVVFFNHLFKSLHALGAISEVPKVEEAHLQEWYEHIGARLSPKKVRYTKAIERILGQPGTNYHASSHFDPLGLDVTFCEHNLCTILSEKKNQFSDDTLKMLWKYISNINRATYAAKDETPPHVPSRDEIQKNIKTKSSRSVMRDNQPSMTKAFHASLVVLVSECEGNAALTGSWTESDIDAAVKRWSELVNTPVAETNFQALCESKSANVLPLIQTRFPELNLTICELSVRCWTAITHMNSYAAVDDHIPRQMMGRIEHMANQIAGDIVAGKADLSSLDLTDIGQQVLAGCSESDMSQFAANIDQLLPAIQAIHKGM